MNAKQLYKLRKVSYFCLTLYSTALNFIAPAAESFSKDCIDYSIKEGTVRFSQQSESFTDIFERVINTLFNAEGEQQRQDLRKYIIDDYSNKNPSLPRNRLPSIQNPKNINLLSTTNKFCSYAESLKNSQIANYQMYQQTEKDIIDGTYYGLKELIEYKVKDPEAKEFFSKKIENVREEALKFLFQ